MHLSRFGVCTFILAMLVSGCTTNSPGHAGYESRAATTAERMGSPVATGALLAKLGRQGNLLGPFAKTATTGTLDEAEEIQSSFSHVQPPDQRSEKIRRQLDPLLVRSTALLTDLRIAARKGDLEALGRFEAPLSKLAKDLERFQKVHLQ